MRTLYESLLDDEEEVMNRVEFNIFDFIYNSRSEDEWQRQVQFLKDACEEFDLTKMTVEERLELKEQLSKDKKSLFFCHHEYHGSSYLMGSLCINRAFKASAKTSVTLIKSTKYKDTGPGNIGVDLHYTDGKIDPFTKYKPFSKHTHPAIFYRMPKKVEDEFYKWAYRVTAQGAPLANMKRYIYAL
jgi:hypothetical protein